MNDLHPNPKQNPVLFYNIIIAILFMTLSQYSGFPNYHHISPPKKSIKLCLRYGRASLIHSSKLFNIPYWKTKLEDIRIIYPSFSQQSLFCISCSASVNLPTAATNCGVRNDFKNKMLFSFSCVSCPSQWKSHGIGFQVQFSAMVTELSG